MIKKAFSFVIILTLLLSLVSCGGFGVHEFSQDGITYYYEYSDGIKTVTNYHPTKLSSLPTYQEMVQLGDGAGLENEGVVYFVYAVDTTIDPDDEKAYYSAELDGTTKQLLLEDGEYFATEAEKEAFISRLIALIDADHP